MLTLTNKTLGIAIIITISTTVLTLDSTLEYIYVDMEELNTPGNELESISVSVPLDIEAYRSTKVQEVNSVSAQELSIISCVG